MVDTWVVVAVSFAYLGLLFAIAYYGDQRADRAAASSATATSTRCRSPSTPRRGRSTAASAARRRAAIGFLPIYLGPTLMVALWWVVLRKIIRISKAQPHHLDRRLHRVALRQEPAARRAGHGHRRDRHHPLHRAAAEGGLDQLHDPAAGTRTPVATPVTDAVADPAGHRVLRRRCCWPRSPSCSAPATSTRPSATRAWSRRSRSSRWSSCSRSWRWASSSPSASSTASATSSAGPHGSPSSPSCSRCAPRPATARWVWLTVLSMLAILFLPRQFQVTVVENVDERHVRKAIWLFPLYLLLINIFVLPIALRRPAALSARAASTPTPSCSRCRWPTSSTCWRCSSSSAGCRRPPAW